MYEGPDAHISCLDIPDEGIDVFNVAAGRRLDEDDAFVQLNTQAVVKVEERIILHESSDPLSRNLAGDIVPGKGWEIWDEPDGKWLKRVLFFFLCFRGKTNSRFLLRFIVRIM